MGLFSRKKRQSSEESLSPNKNKWFNDYNNWDYDEDKINAAWMHFLNDLKSLLSDTKIIEPNDAADNYSYELRGKMDGLPVKFETDTMDYSYSNPPCLNVIIKLKDYEGDFDLTRDHDKIPMDKDDDDWGDEDQDIRVFVGKGIFVEGDEDRVCSTLAYIDGFPEDITDAVLQQMEEIPILYYRISYDQLEVFPEDSPILWENPIDRYTAILDLMGKIAKHVLGSNVESDNIEKKILTKYKRVKCKYCSSHFLMGETSNCPNCGGSDVE
ncbi:MAG: hypothetical protein C0592_13190 [Marinilabiliales bacterium]|nr:MAG: hypothetical protein C0592_13190 [Marinilabiliales bacterium]